MLWDITQNPRQAILRCSLHAFRNSVELQMQTACIHVLVLPLQWWTSQSCQHIPFKAEESRSWVCVLLVFWKRLPWSLALRSTQPWGDFTKKTPFLKGYIKNCGVKAVRHVCLNRGGPHWVCMCWGGLGAEHLKGKENERKSVCAARTQKTNWGSVLLMCRGQQLLAASSLCGWPSQAPTPKEPRGRSAPLRVWRAPSPSALGQLACSPKACRYRKQRHLLLLSCSQHRWEIPSFTINYRFVSVERWK